MSSRAAATWRERATSAAVSSTAMSMAVEDGAMGAKETVADAVVGGLAAVGGVVVVALDAEGIRKTVEAGTRVPWRRTNQEGGMV